MPRSSKSASSDVKRAMERRKAGTPSKAAGAARPSKARNKRLRLDFLRPARRARRSPRKRAARPGEVAWSKTNVHDLDAAQSLSFPVDLGFPSRASEAPR